MRHGLAFAHSVADFEIHRRARALRPARAGSHDASRRWFRAAAVSCASARCRPSRHSPRAWDWRLRDGVSSSEARAAASGDQKRRERRPTQTLRNIRMDRIVQSLSSAVEQRAFRGGLARGEVLLDSRDAQIFRLLISVQHLEQSRGAAAEEARPGQRECVVGSRAARGLGLPARRARADSAAAHRQSAPQHDIRSSAPARAPATVWLWPDRYAR